MYVSSGVEVAGGPVQVMTGLEAPAWLTFTLADAGLWLWMIKPIRDGRPWARVAGTYLFALSTLATMFTIYAELGFLRVRFIQAHIAFGVFQWALALAVTVLVWTPESNQYCQRMTEVNEARRG
jgi:hypothetical protein